MIISLSGIIGSGKDTAANYLVSEYGFIKVSFADCVKDVLSSMFNWDRSLLQGDTIESREFRNTIDIWWSMKLGIKDFTPRLAMTLIGTDVMRKYLSEDIWLLCLERKIDTILGKNPNANIVVTDARFINELDMLHKYKPNYISVNVIRNTPVWVKSAYNYNRAKKLEKIYLKLKSKFNVLYSSIRYYMLARPKVLDPDIFNSNIHISEYQHIGYYYDRVIMNTKTPSHVYNQLDMLAEDKGIACIPVSKTNRTS